MINIENLAKSDVLAALYNASRPQGMGFLAYDADPMSSEEAEELLKGQKHFDYLKGRVMKLDLSSDTEFYEGLYDRDNGQGAAQRCIDSLRESSNPNSEGIKKQHVENVEQSAALTKNHIHEETRIEDGVITLGLAGAKDVLGPSIRKAKESNS